MARPPRPPGAALTGLALAALLIAPPAAVQAHLAPSRATLLSLVVGSELSAHVRIVDPHERVVLPGGEQRGVVRAAILERLRGPAVGAQDGEIRFASHGHGVAEYAAGDEALVFLVPLARSRELSALSQADIDWVSLQEHDTRWLVPPGEGRALVLDAARSYAAATTIGDAEARVAALRTVTLDLLASRDARLADSALRDVVAAPTLPLVTPADAPSLVAHVVRDGGAPLAVRVGLLTELERRAFLDAGPEWLALLEATPLPSRLQVVRAAGGSRSAEVEAALVGLLAADAVTAEAAAHALGRPAHAGAVPALSEAIAHDERRVRLAAVRALGAIGTPSAHQALDNAAVGLTDAETRRHAGAEARRLREAR